MNFLVLATATPISDFVVTYDSLHKFHDGNLHDNLFSLEISATMNDMAVDTRPRTVAISNYSPADIATLPKTYCIAVRYAGIIKCRSLPSTPCTYLRSDSALPRIFEGQ